MRRKKLPFSSTLSLSPFPNFSHTLPLSSSLDKISSTQKKLSEKKTISFSQSSISPNLSFSHNFSHSLSFSVPLPLENTLRGGMNRYMANVMTNDAKLKTN